MRQLRKRSRRRWLLPLIGLAVACVLVVAPAALAQQAPTTTTTPHKTTAPAQGSQQAGK